MKQRVNELLDSGLIASYVMGLADAEICAEMDSLAMEFPEVRQAITDFELQLEDHLFSQAVAPSSTIKPMIAGMIGYQERIRRGENPGMPPVLQPDSKAADYASWLALPGMQQPDQENITAKIIGLSNTSSIAILWLREGTPVETHEKELESFLILEGTCIITIGEERHLLSAGDYLAIPLHKPHHVLVTSSIPCKAILQRRAA